jgi:hypothetical protein
MPETEEILVMPIDESLTDLPILPEGVKPEDSRALPTLYQFKALTSWFDENFKSSYVAGQRYFVRHGNEKLNAAVKGWVKKKMVTLGG